MSQEANSQAPSREPTFGRDFTQGISAGSVQAQLEKILASEVLVHSERLRRFLRFTVQEVLQGRAQQLKESLLGNEVYDRKHFYDPRADPIVRVEAHRLRSKIKEYYETEGRKDSVLIQLPKGSYVPVFRKRESEGPEGDRRIAERRVRDVFRQRESEAPEGEAVGHGVNLQMNGLL